VGTRKILKVAAGDRNWAFPRRRQLASSEAIDAGGSFDALVAETPLGFFAAAAVAAAASRVDIIDSRAAAVDRRAAGGRPVHRRPRPRRRGPAPALRQNLRLRPSWQRNEATSLWGRAQRWRSPRLFVTTIPSRFGLACGGARAGRGGVWRSSKRPSGTKIPPAVTPEDKKSADSGMTLATQQFCILFGHYSKDKSLSCGFL